MRRMRSLAMLGLGLACLMVATGALADQEPNNDFAGAEQLPAGTATGDVDIDTDEEDYYKFTVSEGQYITVEFEADTGQDFLYGYLADWEEWTIFELKSKGGVAESATWHTCNETPERTWYFYVESDTESGGYEFTVTLTDQNDGGFLRDAGGAMDLASKIVPGTTITGLLADDDEEDWYSFPAGEGDIIKVALTSDSDADFIYVDLIDWEDWTILTIKSKDSVTADDTYYTSLERVTRLWYIRVHMDTDMGHYDMALTVDHQDDAGTGTEAPADTASSLELVPGTYTGHLEDEDEVDAYKFQMGGGDALSVSFTSASAADFLYLELVDWEGWTLWELSSKESSEAEGGYLTANESAVAWYYLVVGSDTEPGGYEMTFAVTHQDDGASGEDTPEALADGLILQAGTLTGSMGDADGADAYRIAVEVGWTVKVTVTNQADVAAEVGVIGDTGSAPLETLSSSQGVEDTWEGIIEIDHATDGYLYLLVAPGNAADWVPGGYTLKVEVATTPADTEPPQATLDREPTRIEEGKAKVITVTATDNEGIEDATLYFRIDDEVVWSEVDMTADGDSYSAEIPEDVTMDAKKVEYVVVVWDTAGNNVTIGDWMAPKSMKVTEPPEDDGPGFGIMVTVAALALLTAAMAGRRRRGA